MKEFADENYKLHKNGRKLSKWVENTVAKGEIARYEQFLLFPQCFQKDCFPGASKGVIVWEWVKTFGGSFHTVLKPLLKDKILDLSKLKAFADNNLNVNQKLKVALGRIENIKGKGENADYQLFLHFPQCFQKASFLGSLKVLIVWSRFIPLRRDKFYTLDQFERL